MHLSHLSGVNLAHAWPALPPRNTLHVGTAALGSGRVCNQCVSRAVGNGPSKWLCGCGCGLIPSFGLFDEWQATLCIICMHKRRPRPLKRVKIPCANAKKLDAAPLRHPFQESPAPVPPVPMRAGATERRCAGSWARQGHDGHAHFILSHFERQGHRRHCRRGCLNARCRARQRSVRRYNRHLGPVV